VSVCPACGVPETVGFAVRCGALLAAARTIAVGTDIALVDPSAFVAVTRTRSVLPTSFDATVYSRLPASEICEQLPPVFEQRNHW
jgi:hypothetical protein